MIGALGLAKSKPFPPATVAPEKLGNVFRQRAGGGKENEEHHYSDKERQPKHGGRPLQK